MPNPNGELAATLKAIAIYGFRIGQRYENVDFGREIGTLEITHINERGFITLRIETVNGTTSDGMSPGSLAELLCL